METDRKGFIWCPMIFGDQVETLLEKYNFRVTSVSFHDNILEYGAVCTDESVDIKKMSAEITKTFRVIRLNLNHKREIDNIYIGKLEPYDFGPLEITLYLEIYNFKQEPPQIEEFGIRGAL